MEGIKMKHEYSNKVTYISDKIFDIMVHIMVVCIIIVFTIIIIEKCDFTTGMCESIDIGIEDDDEFYIPDAFDMMDMNIF